MREKRECNVVAHAHRREGGCNLEGSSNAALRNLMRRQAIDPIPEQVYGAPVGAELSAEHVETGRLARAIRTYECDDLRGRDGERHVQQRFDAAEALGQA